MWYNIDKKGGEEMELADFEGSDFEMMSDTTLSKLIEYLKTVEKWTDAQIISLLEYISKK